MTYKIQIVRIDEPRQPTSAVEVFTPAPETVIYTQFIDDLNVSQLIRDLNKTPRRRKAKAV